MIGTMNYFISFYISIWSTIAYSYIDQNIPKLVLAEERPYEHIIRYDQNRLILPYPENTLSQFHQKMEALTSQKPVKLNIVHLGDSHIQADLFSGQVRSLFHDAAQLGTGGRGYIFPGSMAGSHNPFNLKSTHKGQWVGCQNVQYKKSCSWGLGGMTATTRDSNASFEIDPNARSSRTFNTRKVKVYYPVSDPNSYQITMSTPQGEIEPARINYLGYAEFILSEPIDVLKFKLRKTAPNQNHFVLEGLSLENDYPGVQYHSMGVNGAMVSSFLRCPKLEDQLRSLEPDLVIVSLGTNDAYGLNFDADAFKLNMAKLIQKVKRSAPSASIILTTPADCALYNRSINPSNQKARAKLFELAEESNCAIWDLYEIMGGYGSINKWLKEKLCAYDRVHFSGKGYRLQGDLLYDALIHAYADYRLHR